MPLPRSAQTAVLWRWPFKYLEWCRDHYGSCFTLRTTPYPPLVILSDRADIRAVLTAPADAVRPGEGAVDAIAPVAGPRSFMLQDDEEHVAGRRAVVSAFDRDAVERHTDMVGEVARRAVESWPRDRRFSLQASLRAITLEVILRATFTWHGAASEQRLRAIRDLILRMLAITGKASYVEPAVRRSVGRIAWQRFLRERSELDELVYALIDERRDTPRGSSGTVLDTLLTSRGREMSREHLHDNVMSVILAGHETTAAQLAWAFQLLAHNPGVQQRLTREIDRGESSDYLDATVSEILRNRPVFPFTIPRAVSRPIDIGGREYLSPVRLLGCIYLLHHDPVLYRQPYQFKPERFLEAPPQPQTWIPWGGGRKRCPGLHMATLEIKTVLRAVLSQVTVHPTAKHIERPRWRSVIVTPHAGSCVVLRERDRRYAGVPA